MAGNNREDQQAEDGLSFACQSRPGNHHDSGGNLGSGEISLNLLGHNPSVPPTLPSYCAENEIGRRSGQKQLLAATDPCFTCFCPETSE